MEYPRRTQTDHVVHLAISRNKPGREDEDNATVAYGIIWRGDTKKPMTKLLTGMPYYTLKPELIAVRDALSSCDPHESISIVPNNTLVEQYLAGDEINEAFIPDMQDLRTQVDQLRKNHVADIRILTHTLKSYTRDAKKLANATRKAASSMEQPMRIQPADHSAKPLHIDGDGPQSVRGGFSDHAAGSAHIPHRSVTQPATMPEIQAQSREEPPTTTTLSSSDDEFMECESSMPSSSIFDKPQHMSSTLPPLPPSKPSAPVATATSRSLSPTVAAPPIRPIRINTNTSQLPFRPPQQQTMEQNTFLRRLYRSENQAIARRRQAQAMRIQKRIR
ncbi:hypothetical protein BDB00DRAFT_813035 [Zychaea mexicana]|uniref:uncharacterized protein n=1 Tax=Zychaea mexicana TaxID=64656 RepID=UPI0022FE178B|nr:uncharacterized protein BDB00DRAFT_813035 [Zychaea mexicana]KAI9495692.1 hypothetical protein BDB00DRAFT_813035 [Zychaea mexicana]